MINWSKEWRTPEQIAALERAMAVKYVDDPEPMRTFDEIAADEAGMDRYRPL